jgi:hypothetical protein
MSVRQGNQQEPYESFFVECIASHLTNGEVDGAFLSSMFALKGCSLR